MWNKIWKIIDWFFRTFALCIGLFLMLLSLFKGIHNGGLQLFMFGGLGVLFGLSHDPDTKHHVIYIKKKDAEELVKDK